MPVDSGSEFPNGTLGNPPTLSNSERRVFEAVWRRRPISRTNVANVTGMTPMLVTRVVRTLHEKGLVSDSPDYTGQRGQPPRPIDVVPTAAASIGVSFSYTSAEIVVSLLDGTIVERKKHKLAEFSPSSLAQAVDDEIEQFLATRRVSKDRILGIGVTVPADFIGDASFDFSNKPKFNPFAGDNLKTLFQSSTSHDIIVENDSTAAAIGEMIYGVGRNYENFLFINIGYGIGAGVIFDRNPYRGSCGNAGVIGIHFPYDQPRPSGEDLIESLRASNLDVARYADLNPLVTTNCPELARWVKRAGAQLRDKLSYSVRLLDPDALVIGGRLPSHINQYLASEIDSVEFCASSPNLPKPRIVASILGPQALSLGAASLPIYRRLLTQNI